MAIPGALPVQRAERGEHLCQMHHGEEERRAFAGAFAAEALGAGDRLLYIAPGDAVQERERVGRELAESGLDVARPLRTGQILVAGFGAADGEWAAATFGEIAASFRAQADRSDADGYPGLRIFAAMDRAQAVFGSFEELMRWELYCSRLMSDRGISGVCQYAAAGRSPGELSRIAEVHMAVADDNGRRPIALLTSLDGAGGLAIAGDLDRSNAHLLAAAIAARARGREVIELDLSESTFIDLAGIRAIGEAAAAAPVRVRVRGMPAVGRRVIELLDQPQPDVEYLPR